MQPKPVCQSWESKGQLSVIAIIGGIMGYGDRAKGLSVTKEDGLALWTPLERKMRTLFLIWYL